MEVNLVVVVQVMLIWCLLHCKLRPLRLWEFNPEGPRALQHFMGLTPAEMYKLFFLIARDASGIDRGCWPKLQSPRYSSK